LAFVLVNPVILGANRHVAADVRQILWNTGRTTLRHPPQHHGRSLGGRNRRANFTFPSAAIRAEIAERAARGRLCATSDATLTKIVAYLTREARAADYPADSVAMHPNGRHLDKLL
jgi:hypothetical protein